MELFHIPPRRLWVSPSSTSPGVVESFAAPGDPSLAEWKRGEVVQAWQRDQLGRIIATSDNGRNVTYKYEGVRKDTIIVH